MASKQKIFLYDYWLLLIVFALSAIGLLMVASASMVISDRQYHTPFHFLFHQLTYMGIGIFLGSIAIRVPLVFWEKIGAYLLLCCLFLLVMVLVPDVGREINGSIRWLGFGPFGIQVSELAKFCIVIYMAGYLVRHQQEVQNSFSGFVKPMLLFAIIAVLLLLEPDFGAVAVIMLTILGMIFLAGARLWQFVSLVLLVAIALTVLAIASPYRMIRLTTFLHPWVNQFSSGYQLTQSLIAFGRGGIFGVGLGNSIQKLFYLPEAHTDFLFAVLAEELGLIGQVVVLGLFACLISRILFIARIAGKTGKLFIMYMTYGFALWLSLQTIINIGVNIGILPTKGLTLPFMSYGGSSLLFNFLVIAILLRIYNESLTS
jgi:cell division protein FtsW